MLLAVEEHVLCVRTEHMLPMRIVRALEAAAVSHQVASATEHALLALPSDCRMSQPMTTELHWYNVASTQRVSAHPCTACSCPPKRGAFSPEVAEVDASALMGTSVCMRSM